MRRWRFIITESNRNRVLEWVRRAPAGYRVEIKETKRSVPQNDRMWAMLTDVSVQKPGGRSMTPDQWKVLFMHACGREVQFLPALEGPGFVPYGQSSSDLSVGEMSELIEFMLAWGARQEPPVAWSEPSKLAEAA